MKQFATNYFLENNNERVFSRIFVFHSLSNIHKYNYIEIYSTGSLKPFIRKNLSPRMVKYFLGSKGWCWYNVAIHSNIGCYVCPFGELEELDRKISTYMPRDVAKSVCNWVKEEIG